MSRRGKMVLLAELLRAACTIYEELMLTAPSDIERRDWAIDADDVERAAGFASSQASQAA